MASKRIHREAEGVTTNGFSNLDNLLRRSVLKAALNQKVSKAIDHQRIGLGSNRLDNVILLIRGAHFELLLEEDGCLLVVAADDLVNNILLVAVDIAVEQATVVERLSRGQERLVVWSVGL